MNLKYILLFLMFSSISCNKEKKVDFDFVETIEIEENFTYTPQFVSNREQFVHFFSQQHKPLYHVRQVLSYDKFEFDTFDYLFTFSSELIEVRTTKDECTYLSKIPIKCLLNVGKRTNNMYIYRISKKDNYRTICP